MQETIKAFNNVDSVAQQIKNLEQKVKDQEKLNQGVENEIKLLLKNVLD